MGAGALGSGFGCAGGAALGFAGAGVVFSAEVAGLGAAGFAAVVDAGGSLAIAVW